MKQYAPATERNRQPILEILQQVLPATGTVLEISSGTGGHTAPSNAAFDESLQARNPEWGVRDLETIIATARDNHLQLQQVYPMPANNLSVVFQKI